MLQVLK